MRKWYYKDEGRTILYGFPEDVSINHPLAVELPDRPGSDYILDQENKVWVLNPQAYIQKRRDAYPPIGDQLDAILKHFNYMQMVIAREDITFEDKIARCCNCVTDLDDIITKWLSVKARFPKL